MQVLAPGWIALASKRGDSQSIANAGVGYNSTRTGEYLNSLSQENREEWTKIK